MKHNPQPRRTTHQIILPNRESVNAAQLGLLLQTAQSLVGCLRQPDTEWNQSNTPSLDGGAKMAIEQSLIRTCARIDAVMTDTTRWGFEVHQQLEKQMTEMYEQNTNLLRAQTRLAEEAVRPSARYRPRLLCLNGTWTAVLGDLNDIDNAICGVGGSPDEALRAFDEIFAGQIPAHLVNWLRAVEEANLRGRQPPSYFKNETDQNNPSVDDTRDRTTNPTQGDGSDAQGNRPDDGPDGQSRGPEAGPTPENPDAAI